MGPSALWEVSHFVPAQKLSQATGDRQSTQIQYKTQSIGLLLPRYSLVTNQSYL